MTDLQFKPMFILLSILLIESTTVISNPTCERYCDTDHIDGKLQTISFDLQNFSSILSHMQADYLNQKFESFAENAHTLLRGTDVFYQLEDILHRKSCAESNFTATLNSIAVKLKNLNDTIHSLQNEVFNRISSTKSTEVAKINKFIESTWDCLKNTEKLMQDITSLRLLLIVVNCYEKETAVREIGSIVNSSTLFDDITTTKSGRFNGTHLYPTYGSIMGLYTIGCITISTSESVKYAMQQTKLKNECIVTIRASHENILRTCKSESCANIEFTIRNLSDTADVNDFGSKLEAFYPCLYFLILRFLTNVKETDIQISGSPDHIKIKDDKHYQIVLWSTEVSRSTKLDSVMYLYEIKFVEGSFEGIYNGVNLTNMSSSSDTNGHYLGYFPNSGKCNKQKDDDIPTYPFIIIGVIIGVGILVVVIVFYFCRRRKQSKNTKKTAKRIRWKVNNDIPMNQSNPTDTSGQKIT